MKLDRGTPKKFVFYFQFLDTQQTGERQDRLTRKRWQGIEHFRLKKMQMNICRTADSFQSFLKYLKRCLDLLSWSFTKTGGSTSLISKSLYSSYRGRNFPILYSVMRIPYYLNGLNHLINWLVRWINCIFRCKIISEL